MAAIWIAADSFLHSNVLMWDDKEVSAPKDIKGKDIKIVGAIQLLALMAVANFKMIGSMLAIGCALHLNAKQDAIVV